MLRKINILPLFLACFMILGHSVFPHTHKKTNGDEFIFGIEALNCESGVFGLLHDVFAQDLGDNHLENYNTAQHDMPAFLFVAQAFLHTLLQFSVEVEDEKTFNFLDVSPKVFAEFIINDAPLRAPPRL